MVTIFTKYKRSCENDKIILNPNTITRICAIQMHVKLLPTFLTARVYRIQRRCGVLGTLNNHAGIRRETQTSESIITVQCSYYNVVFPCIEG